MQHLCSKCKKRDVCRVANEIGYYEEVVADRIGDTEVPATALVVIVACDDFEKEEE